MGSFGREKVGAEPSFKRIHADIGVTGGGEAYSLKQFTIMAQDSSDGKFYPWDSGIDERSIIAGIYTGEDLEMTAGADLRIGINTLCVIGKTDIVGVDFDSDFTALSELKRAGVFIVDKIEGMEEY